MGVIASPLGRAQLGRTCRQRATIALLACALLLAGAARAVADNNCHGFTDKSQCPPALSSETARGLGLGTGVRASAIGTSALSYSPAALSLGNLYHIEGNVDYLSDLHAVALGAAVVDSSTSKVGAGIGLRGFLSGANRVGGLDGRLGIALQISDAFALGVAGRYIDISADSDPYQIDVRGFTMDASLRITPIEGLQIDVGALNFIDLNSPFVPVTLGGGVAFAIMPQLSVGADVLADMTTLNNPALRIGGGVEYLAGSSLPLRLGYSVDAARDWQFIGAGIGYTDQHMGLDLGVRQQLKGQDVNGGKDTRVMGAFRYYVQ
jgi:hypothetical protein